MNKLLIFDAFTLLIRERNVANYALLRCKTLSLKIWLCRIFDKYHVWGAPQSTTSIRLTMPDHVSKYPKDCSSRIGEQLCAAAECEGEMCLIDGKKYESRAQRSTLSTFFGLIGF